MHVVRLRSFKTTADDTQPITYTLKLAVATMRLEFWQTTPAV